MMDEAWTVVFAADAASDLGLIEDHLIQAYQAFGESPSEAAQRAEVRIDAIIASAERLVVAPYRGEAREDMLPGVRYLAIDKAVYWFLPDPDARQIRVLAVFFGAQDHQRHMLVRLLQKGSR